MLVEPRSFPIFRRLNLNLINLLKSKLKAFGIYIRLITFILLLISSASVWAESLILFTGTFDPFHKNHLEQLEGALDAIPGSTAEIHAIELAPHSAIVKRTGLALPTLLNYSLRVEVIKAAISFDSRVSVRNDFRVFSSVNEDDTISGMAAVTDMIRSKPENNSKKIYHLIGTDTLITWLKNGEIDKWPREINFVVGANPELKDDFERFKNQFKGDRRFVFFDRQTKTVRSTMIREEFLNGTIDWKNYLPAQSALFLTTLPQAQNPRIEFISKQLDFLIQYTEQEVLPLLAPEFRDRWPNEISKKLSFAELLYQRRQSFDPMLQRIFDRARRAYANIPYMKLSFEKPSTICELALAN